VSKYEEIRDVAAAARKSWISQRDRCWSYMGNLVNGFVKYCGVPFGQITYLRSNEASGELRAYREPEDGGRYTLLRAIVFDDEDGYYHLGLCVTLTPPNVFPPQWVSFALCVTEKDGKPTVKIGFVGEPRQIDLNDASQCGAFYEGIVESLKQCFRDPKKSNSKTIGFGVSSDEVPAEGAKQTTPVSNL
jgi:hypothetical protein